VVLDDDPTGTQTSAQVSVVLEWSPHTLAAARQPGDRALHIVTNARAHAGDEAAQLTRSAAAAARVAFPSARIVLRGDSTLRGHVGEEYEAVRTAAGTAGNPPLLLVMALPAAGRLTRQGVHLLMRDGDAVPLHLTEYARDRTFGYSTATLSEWAEERSAGRFRATRARRVELGALRAEGGAAAVAAALGAAWRAGQPAVVVPDAETDQDLAIIADGLREAERDSVPVIVRCAPAFAGVLSGTTATRPALPPPSASSVLVLCGSYVPGATDQLVALEAARPGTLIEVDIRELMRGPSAGEAERVAAAASGSIRTCGLAVVATPRRYDGSLTDVTAQRRLAVALAEVARLVPASATVAKGGITSAITARAGLGVGWARVEGPLLPGVSLWTLPDDRSLAVVPGNVGGSSLLVELVDLIVKGRAS
jgi:uncharacterized protein YgbK (DUF1537 family)